MTQKTTTPSPLSGQLDRSALTERFAATDPKSVGRLIARLKTLLEPGQIIDDRARLLAFSYDATGERHLPDAVVMAHGAGDVEAVVQAARENRVYLVPRGSSSNLSGGTTPVLGGLVLSLTRLKTIHRIDVQNREAVFEPGLINAELQQALEPWGFFYPPDPASHRISTLGGNVAENSGGPHCVKYGVTTNHILQLEVVLANGQRALTPTVRDYRVGFDITGLLTGSEGTMAVMTQITASIAPKPEHTATMLAVFASVEDALNTVTAIISRQIVPSTLELMDKKSLEVVEPFVHAGYPVGAGAILLIEVDGPEAVVAEQVAGIRTVAEEGHAGEFRVAQSDLEADALWRGRRSHYGAAARIAPHLWIQDVTVPRPLLADMMQEVIRVGQRYGFEIFCSAHAGDGNLHPIITYDPANADEVRRMHAADRDILQACVDRGGAITGEHGIGIDKLENLSLMYGPRERQLMADLKKAFDPEGLLNPVKVVLAPEERPDDPVPGSTRIPAAPGAVWAPETALGAAEAVMQARMEKRHLSVGGNFTSWALTGRPLDTPLSLTRLKNIVDYDKANLTVEVEAGAVASELAQWLHAEGLDSPFLPYSGDDTIGGLVASNARHWRSAYLMGWRDVVLGVEWIDGRGQILRFGRKTMKNVAGYDVTKLAVGSWGRLGILSKVILRLRPFGPDPVFGYAQGPQIQPLLDMALQLGTSALRPDGLVLTRMRPGDLRLWFSHESAGPEQVKALVEQLCRNAGVDLTWVPGSAWAPWEQERTHAWNRALQHGSYGEGGVSPRDLYRLWESIGENVCTVVYPGSGAYEVFQWFGDVPRLPGMSRVKSQAGYWERPLGPWQEISDRIERIFDPGGVFAAPQSDARGGA